MRRILVVDDDEQFRNVICRILRRAGHSVVEAVDGSEVPKVLAREGFDLILLDILMPEQEGLATIREIRRQDRALKIVAMSGGGRTSACDNLKMAIGLGANASLTKPFATDELLQLIQDMCSGKGAAP